MPSITKQELIDELIKHNITLQDKTTELIIEIKALTGKIEAMVHIFSEAAESIKKGTDQPLMKKLEDLLEQNKSIAKGLIMLEKYVRDKAIGYDMPKPLKKI